MNLALILAAAVSQSVGASAPELDGHVFLPVQLVDSPFRSTTFKLGILYGFGSATGDKYDSSGNVVGKADYSYADLAQTFRYEYAFIDWLSVGAVILSNLYSGIDGPSAVAIGANFQLGAGARLKAGHRIGPVEAAFIFEADTAPEFGYLVGAAIIKAIRDKVLDPWAAFQQKKSVTLTPQAAFAWAPTPAFGLTANIGYTFKSLKVNGTSLGEQGALLVAIAADFDLEKASSVPLGLSIAYRLTSPVGDGPLTRVQDYTGGLFYTAHRELGLGLELGGRNFNLKPELDTTVVLTQLVLQYYW